MRHFAAVARRDLRRVFLPIFIAALVVACSTKDESAAAAKPEQVLHVYN